MIYVLECMFRIIIATVPDDYGPLLTTGKALTGKDISVGFLGCLAIASLIVGVANLIAYKKYNPKNYELENSLGLRRATKKYLKITAIIFLVLCPLSIIINIFVCCFA